MPPVKTANACALPGTLSDPARDRLPDRAFGLPRQRKYPMYRLVAGKLVPDGSHAANAKARARQQYKQGNLTFAQLQQINRKADRVLAQCGARGGKRDNPGPSCAKARATGHRVALRRALRRDR